MINASINVDYSPVESDRIRTVDGKTYNGKTIYHPIDKSGIYSFYVESKIDKRRKASNSMVIKNSDGDKILQTKTDKME
jgi:hypothetical protein